MRKTRFLKFTLVELLVVIAVIAIMMTLLLPSLQRAREMAKSIACIGNERQQGLAWQSYLADNNSYFPYYWPYNAGGGTNIYWFDLFDPYDAGGKMWKCPSHDYPKWRKGVGSFSYGYNHGCYLKDTNNHGLGTVNTSRLKDVAGDILMCDSAIGSDGWSCIVEPPNHLLNYLNPRHNVGMNLLWADGHATWTSYVELLRKNPGTWGNPPPGWYGCLPWFRDSFNINNS